MILTEQHGGLITHAWLLNQYINQQAVLPIADSPSVINGSPYRLKLCRNYATICIQITSGIVSWSWRWIHCTRSIVEDTVARFNPAPPW